MLLIFLFLYIFKVCFSFVSFFCCFVKFKPEILFSFIAADVMMLLVFVQCLCIVAPRSFAIQIRMVASTCVFSAPPPPLLPLPRPPQSLGPLLSLQ